MQRKAERESDSVPDNYHRNLGPGQPLDPAARAFMESRLSHDFGGVRVHADAQAAESAQGVNALAYSVGQDIVFGTGQYAPGTSVGRRLLAHELTHVIQQEHGSGERIFRQPAPGPPAGQQAQIDTAAERSIDQLERALPLLQRLDTLIRTERFEQDWEYDDLDTLFAVESNLKIQKKDKSHFLTKLGRAIRLVDRNRKMKGNIVRVPGCGGYADAPVGGGASGRLRICDDFFANPFAAGAPTGPQCQRNVLTHERFHLTGIGHGERQGKEITKEARTTDEALNSAHDMTDLVAEVLSQDSWACTNNT